MGDSLPKWLIKAIIEKINLLENSKRQGKLYWNTLNVLINNICLSGDAGLKKKKTNTLKVPLESLVISPSEDSQVLQIEALGYEMHLSFLIWLHSHCQKHHKPSRAFSAFTSMSLQWPWISTAGCDKAQNCQDCLSCLISKACLCYSGSWNESTQQTCHGRTRSPVWKLCTQRTKKMMHAWRTRQVIVQYSWYMIHVPTSSCRQIAGRFLIQSVALLFGLAIPFSLYHPKPGTPQLSMSSGLHGTLGSGFTHGWNLSGDNIQNSTGCSDGHFCF